MNKPEHLYGIDSEIKEWEHKIKCLNHKYSIYLSQHNFKLVQEGTHSDARWFAIYKDYIKNHGDSGKYNWENPTPEWAIIEITEEVYNAKGYN